jgi:hypothetical protein
LSKHLLHNLPSPDNRSTSLARGPPISGVSYTESSVSPQFILSVQKGAGLGRARLGAYDRPKRGGSRGQVGPSDTPGGWDSFQDGKVKSGNSYPTLHFPYLCHPFVFPPHSYPPLH